VWSLTGKLLNALLSGLSDRSASVRKSYATAIGHLVKVRSDKPSSSHYFLDFYAISWENLFKNQGNYFLMMNVIMKRALLVLNLCQFVSNF